MEREDILARLAEDDKTLLLDTPLEVMLCGPGPKEYRAIPRRLLGELKRAGAIRMVGQIDGCPVWKLSSYRYGGYRSMGRALPGLRMAPRGLVGYYERGRLWQS